MRKETICAAIGALAAGLIGQWGTAYWIMLYCQGIDLITGAMVAFVFHKSPKTETGGAESYTMFKGLCRKFGMWLIVALAHQLDVALGINYVATAAVYAFVANEALSIVENCGLMGIVKNEIIINAIDVLKKKSDNMEG